jgi:GntR family transcriptional regulator
VIRLRRSVPETPPRLPKVDRGLLTGRVLEALVEAIQQGAFESGRLPPEPELAERMGVSRTTVQRALQSLEQIGMIERRPGRGTRLRRSATSDLLTIHGLVPFATLLRQNHEVTSRTGWEEHERPPAPVRERLTRPVRTYRVHRVLYADGDPALSMREWIPVDVLDRPLTDDDARLDSILKISAAVFRRPIDHAVATLLPKAATARDAAELRIPRGKPLLFLDEVFYSADDRPLAVSEVSVNPTFVRFSVFRRHLG